MPFKEQVRKHNFASTLLGGAILSILIGYLVSYVPSLFLIVFLVPIVILVLMHYFGLYGLRKRLLYGTVIVILAALLISSAESQVYYSSEHPITATYDNGISATATVSPFSGIMPSYNFSITIVNYEHLSSQNFSLTIASPTFTLNETSLNSIAKGSDITLYYDVPAGHLPLGIYNYSFHFANYTLTGPGPINTNLGTWIADSVISVSFLYFIYYEIILLAGIFLMRSIDHSRSYNKK
ncbi:TVG0190639 [Thermoplasma volcanium GSS1]|uniref:TVG0190639 protein n=1 Tax=Thermoplasma volcanium (strain ATCC 51530 / DSM 4299 / JCM 9571 / NBRC 15438 / GSS1) TaxID=273116 RepID=Q97CB7_THEVO|nr:hypothetical protein [Thermoplasma volcanium]BAB59327.1 TVG0190639 [Thermoplasma volcanium GSS1]